MRNLPKVISVKYQIFAPGRPRVDVEYWFDGVQASVDCPHGDFQEYEAEAFMMGADTVVLGLGDNDPTYLKVSDVCRADFDFHRRELKYELKPEGQAKP
jgi:hypothetical protein